MRYYLAILVTGELGHRVELLRRELSNRFGTRHALKSPPHITLHPPFFADDLDGLGQRLHEVVKKHTPFQTITDGYGSFREDVWYVDVGQEPNLLPLMQDSIEAVKQSISPPPVLPERDPHFHVTLATRDLTPALHREIGAWLQAHPLEPSPIPIDHIALLKHVDARWIIESLFPFGGA